MSLRIDASEWISGAYIVGETSLGVLGAVIASDTALGEDGAGILFNDLDLPADEGKEIRALILTAPGAGVFFVNEDGSFTLTGAPDGIYTFTYRLYVDGAASTTDIGYGAGVGHGTIAIGSQSTMSGGAVVMDMDASGAMLVLQGVITSPPFKNLAQELLANTVIPKVWALRMADMALVLSQTDRMTDGEGRLIVSNASVGVGVQYLLVTSNADGTAFGCEPVVAQ